MGKVMYGGKEKERKLINFDSTKTTNMFSITQFDTLFETKCIVSMLFHGIENH